MIGLVCKEDKDSLSSLKRRRKSSLEVATTSEKKRDFNYNDMALYNTVSREKERVKANDGDNAGELINDYQFNYSCLLLLC